MTQVMCGLWRGVAACSIQMGTLAAVWFCAFASLPTPVAAQRFDHQPVTYRAQNGVLDATGDETPDVDASAASAEDSSGPRRLSEFGSQRFPGSGASDGVREAGDAEKNWSTGPLVTVTSSLAIVLGLFGGLVWLLRRSGGHATAQLPEEVFTLLGRSPLGPRQNVTLARCGRRILVLAVSPNATTTLAEITDPDEVADLTAQCGNGGSRQLFQRTLKEMGEQQPASGFIDPVDSPPRRGLFANG